MKLTPAQNFFRAFQDPLDHAFQNQKFGQRNRQRFISLAMSMESFPGVVKGSRVIPSFPYQISEGSLSIEVNPEISTADSNYIAFSSLATLDGEDGLVITQDMKLGAFSTALLANNPQLQDGDELHIMALVYYANTQTVVPHQVTIVLNSSDTLTTLLDLFGNIPLKFESGEEVLTLATTSTQEVYQLYGAGMIVSRRYTSGWQYSTSYFKPTAAGDAAFNTPELRAAAVESYSSSSSQLVSTRTLQQADNDTSDEGVVARSRETATFALTAALIADGWTAAVSNCSVVKMSDGTRKVVVRTSASGQKLVQRYDTGVGYVSINRQKSGTPAQSAAVAIEDTNLYGNSTIEVDDIPF